MLLAGALVSLATFLLGWALLGVASLRSGAFPLLPSAGLLVGALVAFPSPVFPPRLVVLAVAVTWLAAVARAQPGER